MKTIEWASGLFEGEGCITTDKRTNAHGIEINMTDEDVINDFRDVIDYGNITQRYLNDEYRKPQWRVKIHKQSEVRRILEAMLPYLGLRRAYTALNCLDDIDNIN